MSKTSRSHKAQTARKAVRRGRQAIRVNAVVLSSDRFGTTVERVAGITRDWFPGIRTPCQCEICR
tara:strand:+ start:2536 stop:2730 length:195 start_codon:yes stop_codon:yes gene_type:complete